MPSSIPLVEKQAFPKSSRTRGPAKDAVLGNSSEPGYTSGAENAMADKNSFCGGEIQDTNAPVRPPPMRFGMEFASAMMLRSRVFRDSRTDLISLWRLISDRSNPSSRVA
ncbi:hypothetical protein FHS27_000917 [Rhodopirellula rubra]|uniref:Uncharacterized protein n=1 Tax=Aporhodopirellula rubra TaxID=980271 RepID=A0A7W5H4P2_9BACT|nr:hypothetical protein [Aporhodopirellula rubra]MBB3205150.1 hypothetical protein [Aporhodopirellula rubra]